MKYIFLFLLFVSYCSLLNGQEIYETRTYYKYNISKKEATKRIIRSDKQTMERLSVLPDKEKKRYIEVFSISHALSKTDKKEMIGLCLECLVQKGVINSKEKQIINTLLFKPALQRSFLEKLQKSYDYSTPEAKLMVLGTVNTILNNASDDEENVSARGLAEPIFAIIGRIIGGEVGERLGRELGQEVDRMTRGKKKKKKMEEEEKSNEGDGNAGVVPRPDGSGCDGLPFPIG